MTAYRDDPEDASRIIEPQSGAREIRQAETALHDLEVRLTAALRQKDRLAGLGSAVAKISHDLRNMLTTAQLLADRIEASADPAVRRTAPKLVGSLARAISLCERTLTFGKAEELPPEPTVFVLAPLVRRGAREREAGGDGGLRINFAGEVPRSLKVRADADQLFRVLSNLVRNAAQAIEAGGRAGAVSVRAREAEGRSEIRVSDTGPGPAAEGAGQPLPAVPRQRPAGRRGTRAGDRGRAGQGPRRRLSLEETGRAGRPSDSLPAPARA